MQNARQSVVRHRTGQNVVTTVQSADKRGLYLSKLLKILNISVELFGSDGSRLDRRSSRWYVLPMNILFTIPIIAVLVPFIKATCEHYSASEKQKRADWKSKNSPPTLTPEAAIAAFVALPATERQSRRDAGWCCLLPVLGLLLFIWHPIIAFLCLPITIGVAVSLCRTAHVPSGAPTETEIFQAEVLRRLK